MNPSSLILLFIIWTLICSKSTNAQGFPFIYSLRDDQIEVYLENYLREHEIFPGSLLADDLISTRLAFYRKYTDGSTTSTGPFPRIVLREIIEIYSYVEREVAVIKNLQDCSSLDHLNPEYLAIFEEDKTDQERLTDFRALLISPVSGVVSTTQYCNFFNYLTCQPDPASTTGGYQCLCSSTDLIAEADRVTGDENCKFRTLGTCRGRPDQKLDDKLFAKFDFVQERFDMELENVCEKEVVCNHDDDTCNDPMSMYYFRSLEDIAKVLIQHLIDDGVTGSRQVEAVRYGLEQVRGMHQDISLQISLEERLAGMRGLPCDSTIDPRFRRMLRDYHFGGSSWASPLEISTVRVMYGRMVVDMDIDQTICNHFRLLHCETDETLPEFNTCVCNEGLEWNPIDSRCSILPDGENCSPGPRNSKIEFKFQASPSGVFPVTATFFQETTTLPCGEESICIFMGPIQICFPEAESPEVIKLQQDFEDKFVLDLGAPCNLAQHQSLLGTGAPDYTTHTLRQRRAIIQAIVDDPTIRYCRVKRYQTCDPTTNTCGCFTRSDTNPTEQKCIAFLYNQCGTILSSIHEKFDDLTLIPATLRPVIGETVGCMLEFSSCGPHADPTLMGNVCQCNNLVGPLCNVPINHHASFLMIENLDSSMTSPEGYRVLDGLRERLNSLERQMDLPYGSECDDTLNTELSVVLDYLQEARACCIFTFHGWSCRKPSDTPPCPVTNQLDFTEFDDTLRRVNDLIDTGARFCTRPEGVDCIMGKCQCKPNLFFQMGQCALEIAEICSPDRPPNDPFFPPCRDGLECDLRSRICIISNSAACTSDESAPPPMTLEDAQRQQVECLMSLTSGADSLRRKGNGNACNWQQERQLQRALDKAEVLSDLSKFSGSVDKGREHIRLLQPLSQDLDNLNDVLYCSIETPCLQENEICTDGVDVFGNKIASKANLSSSSQNILIFFLGVVCLYMVQNLKHV